MAVTQIHAIHVNVKKAIDYIGNPDKTDDKLLISGYNCTPETADYEFEFTKRAADSQGGRLAYHLIQSFAPGDRSASGGVLTAGQAHEIGKKLADELLQGNYQYIISTHIDREHIHNHIIFNSVSFTTLKKFHGASNIFHRIARINDKLCHENGLSVVERSGNKGKCYKEHLENKKGTSWKTALRETIDLCIKKARDWDEFLALMQAEEYEVKHGKHISFRAERQKRFTRCKTLGVQYTEENIKARLSGVVQIAPTPAVKTSAKKERTGVSLLIDIENSIQIKRSAGYTDWAKRENLKRAAMTLNYLSDNKLLAYADLTAKHGEVKSKRDTTLARIKEIEKRIKELNAQIKDLDTFRKNKPIVERLDKVVFPQSKQKYSREHESEFILFTAAQKSLNTHFPDKKSASSLPSGEARRTGTLDCKYPLIKTLRAEMSELYAEKKRLYPEYYEAKDEYKDLDVMKNNVDFLLGKTPETERDERSKAQNKDDLE